LQPASTLAKVPQRVGVRRTALGARSEAAQGVDAALLQEVIAALGHRLRPRALPLSQKTSCISARK
jgi:hypothetical protein